MSDLEKLRPSYYSSPKKGKGKQQNFILSTGIRSLLWFSLFISSVIFIDGFLPETESREKIEDWYIVVEQMKLEEYREEFEQAGDILFKLKTTHNEFAIHKADALALLENDSLVIKKTPLFKTLTTFSSPRLGREMKPYINMYGIFICLPAFMLLFSVIGILKKSREDVYITFGVLNIILLCSYFFIRLFYT